MTEFGRHRIGYSLWRTKIYGKPCCKCIKTGGLTTYETHATVKGQGSQISENEHEDSIL